MRLQFLQLFETLLEQFSFANFDIAYSKCFTVTELESGKLPLTVDSAARLSENIGKCFVLFELKKTEKTFNAQGKKFNYKFFALPVNIQVTGGRESGLRFFPNLEEFPLINSDYLDGEHSLQRPEVSLGHSDDYMQALLENQKPNTDVWSCWWGYFLEILQKTCHANLEDLKVQIQQTTKQLLEWECTLVALNNSAASHILGLYAALKADGEESWKASPLGFCLDHYVSESPQEELPFGWFPRVLTKSSPYLLGHMDEQVNSSLNSLKDRELNPLDNTQRQVAYCNSQFSSNAMKSYPRILAVNGPPGSGKTAMLKAIVAHEWVAAALEQRPCPIILAVGATNQAAMNVIGAFSQVPCKGEAHGAMLLYKRWVPHCPSYGSYFPASKFASSTGDTERAIRDKFVVARICGKDVPALYEWFDDNGSLSHPRNLNVNEDYYLKQGWAYFGQAVHEKSSESIGSLVTQLHALLVLTQVDMEKCRNSLLKGISQRNVGMILEKSHENQHKQASEVLHSIVQLMSPGNDIDWERQVMEICRENIRDQARSLKIAEKDLLKDAGLRQSLYQEALHILVERFLDVEFRTKLFHLAARYWEGRFLIENRQTLLMARTRSNVEQGLRRLCMITPCLVSTLHSAPRIFGVSAHLGGEKIVHFAYGAADLLIMDETGQAPLHLSLPVLSLAKKVIAVGDVKQLQPVITDISMLQEQILFRKSGVSQERFSHLFSHALTVTSGSMLHLIRRCSTFSYQGPGLLLRGHYRCQTEIIQLCNEMVYDNKLFFLPHLKKRGGFFPPMTWVDSKAESSSNNGSRENLSEAKMIVQFLFESWPKLYESYKNEKVQPALCDLIAIVTPFKGQAQLIKNLLVEKAQNVPGMKGNRAHITEEHIKKLVVGTVDSLQGAEKDIVIFSAVKTAVDGGKTHFGDQPFLINVAVSRAKKSFIAFACPDLYGMYQAPQITDPLAIVNNSVSYLGYYLGKYGDRLFPKNLVVVEAGGKLKSIQQFLGSHFEVVATGGRIHTLGLAESSLQTKTGLRPRYQLTEEGEKVIHLILEKSARVERIFLATDDDFVGEAIAWHLSSQLCKHNPKLKEKIGRVRLRAITPEALREAFSRPTSIDLNRVAAEVTREICDILIARKLYSTIQKKRGSEPVSQAQVALALENKLIFKSKEDGPKKMGMGRVKSGVLHLLLCALESELERMQTRPRIAATLSVNGKNFKGTLVDVSGKIKLSSAKPIDKQHWTFQLEAETQFCVPAPTGSTIDVLVEAWKKHRLKPTEVMQAMQGLYAGASDA
jgi:hypothetical protein